MPGISVPRIAIPFKGKGGINYAAYWETLISATVEDAAPTHVVLTFAEANEAVTSSDFAVTGFTVASGSWTGAVFTLVLSTPVQYGRTINVIFKTSLTTIATNNVTYITALDNAVGIENVVAHYSIDETSGTTMTDVVNAHNGVYANVTLNQAGYKAGKSGLWALNATGNISGLISSLNLNEGAFICHIKLNELTAFYAFDIWSTGGNSQIFIVHNPSIHTLTAGIKYAGSQVGMTTYLPEVTYPIDQWIQLCITWSVTDNEAKAFINTVPFKTLGETAMPVGSWVGEVNYSALGNAFVGATSGGIKGLLDNVTFMNKKITEEELCNIVKLNHVVFDGDSRTLPYAINIIADIEIAPRVAAVGGQAIETRLAAAAVDVDAKYRDGVENIVVIFGGVNGSATAAADYQNLIDYCTGRKAAGYKVIVCTEIDAQFGDNSFHNVKMPTLNALLIADHSFADGFVNFTTNANLMDATNLTYFDAGQVHLTIAGYNEISDMVLPVIVSLL